MFRFTKRIKNLMLKENFLGERMEWFPPIAVDQLNYNFNKAVQQKKSEIEKWNRWISVGIQLINDLKVI